MMVGERSNGKGQESQGAANGRLRKTYPAVRWARRPKWNVACWHKADLDRVRLLPPLSCAGTP